MKTAVPSGASRPRCFVAMQFGGPFDRLYKEVIEVAVRQTGLLCDRGDRTPSTSYIRDDVWESIQKAQVVIGELTGAAPNVLYEIGLAQAIGRPVVFLANKEPDVPSDLDGIRVVYYRGQSPDRLRREISKNLRAVIDEPLKGQLPGYATSRGFLQPQGSLSSVFKYAHERLKPIIPSEKNQQHEADTAALYEANDRRDLCQSVDGYCGRKKRDAALIYYLHQFQSVKQRECYCVRRMFRRPTSLGRLRLEDMVAILLHAEARKRFAGRVSIKWAEKARLDKDHGLTLFGDQLFVHKGLSEARLTSSPPTPFEGVIVRRVRKAYETAWKYSPTIGDGDIEDLWKCFGRKRKRLKDKDLKYLTTVKDIFKDTLPSMARVEAKAASVGTQAKKASAS